MSLLDKALTLTECGRWDLCRGQSLEKNIYGDIIETKNDGGCISLFKTLMSNKCTHDCGYCQNSSKCVKPEVEYTPEELSKLFLHLNKKRVAQGLFLSSAITGDSDKMTRKMVDSVKLIRGEGFKGYIHFKVLPGVNKDLINEAALYADRMSINLEAPSGSRLNELSSVKDYNVDILRRQRWISEAKPKAGQSTQMVVGAGSETDVELLSTANWEYNTMNVDRVYYSGFVPLKGTPLEDKEGTPGDRVHRLYCADYMLRKYGIKFSEFKSVMDDGMLPKGDPKIHLAAGYFEGPVDLNEASIEELIRVPGIGPKACRNILALRKLKIEIKDRRDLKEAGVLLKRALPYLKVNGHSQIKLRC